MKGLLLFFIAFVFCAAGICQMPESISYQTVVRNASGESVKTKPVAFRFSILSGSITGTVVYSESQTGTTNSDGIVSFSIGSGTEKRGNFSAIDWNGDSYFLKVEQDLTGGSSYNEMSVVQLLNIANESKKKAPKRTTEFLLEDEFLVTRKFVGEFVDYRHTGPDQNDGNNIIWIKTSMDKTFGKLSVYGKACEFTVGENLYIRRIFYSPGNVTGYWIYQLENDSSLFYRLSEFQYDKKVFVETLFLN
jgi:hypothetical protein